MTENKIQDEELELNESEEETLDREDNNNCPNCEKLEEKAQSYLNGWKLAQADYDNLKKQSEKRIKDVIEFGNAEMILDFLPLYNYYKVALDHIPEDLKKEAWFQGLGHIDNLWQAFFEKFSIKKIETVGRDFDHNLQEAIDFGKDESKKDHEILQEVQAGYELNGKVIQAAKVIVNKLN